MPIAAIENAKLFGHWIRHCFRPLMCLFIRVFKNSTSQAGLEPATDRLEGGCSIPLSY
jgi:hypothetical protein